MKQEERTEMTRKKILEAAMEEFGQNGYRGGTIGHICRKGINKGLLYHNYQSKDALYLECVQISVDKLSDALGTLNTEGEGRAVIRQYMEKRMAFYREHEWESRIVFECLMDPPSNLEEKIRRLMKPLDDLNRQMYDKLLSGLVLRKGVTRENAERYFVLAQHMFNAYFGSPSMREKSMDERIDAHERQVPQILDFMLYGIAEKEREETAS